ncbi:MAG: glutamine-hydrolyzing GMP synthase [Actinomycetota bacterium]|nr:glutamine-hydrolyzing GMP synthase [Actinomycetota bacterium]
MTGARLGEIGEIGEGTGQEVRPAPGEERRGAPGEERRGAPGEEHRPADRRGADRPVVVVNFGAQYAQLIARRVREARVYSEIVPHSTSTSEILARRPRAVILSGGPSSIYDPAAPSIDAALLRAGVPVLGICYGFQAIAQALGGEVARTDRHEYGRTKVTVDPSARLFSGQPVSQEVWMSHGDAVVALPASLRPTASTDDSPIAAFETADGLLCGVQWHPEVHHTAHGQEVLERFLYSAAGITPSWTTASVLDAAVEQVREAVGDGRAICGLSGGVDSAVAAAVVQRAIGDRLTCVFVDHGLLRLGEAEQVERDFVAATGIRLETVDARARFLDALRGVVDPEQKRKVIGREFIRAFERAVRDVDAEAGGPEHLVQGTLYPDVVESGGPGGDGTGGSTIKSHHNVGGLPEDLGFFLVEPLRRLFKDEVRMLGLELGLPETIVWRHPFPGPGLAVRIVGEVTEERLEILQQADAIAREELTASGLDRAVWQFPVVLLADVRSVGVQGDARTYGHPVVLRPVTSEDAMTADWARLPYEVLERISTRITNEVTKVNRVVLDVTSKPPGTIEWE